MTSVEAEFIGIFQDEARERIDRIVETLLALESGRHPEGAVDSLLRHTHTIKGSAAMVGLDAIRELAHGMEDLLSPARDGGTFQPELIEPLLRSADAIRRHVDEAGRPPAPAIELATVPDNPPAVAAAPPFAGAAPPVRQSARSIRVPPEKIDTLLDIVGETVLHRRRLEFVLNEGLEQPISNELDVGEGLLAGLKEAAIGMRTLPLSSIVGSLPRAVRDLAIENAKEAELFVTGADTALDRVILEGLSELLVHLLRNAIAHGIEPPAERELQGKPTCGRIEIRAEQHGGVVEVVVSDDGRGVSAALAAEGQRIGSLADVLTRPGFSTAGEVSSIAGRGVGLDAVKAQVEAFRGSLEVRSNPGHGTEIVLHLPLALALLEVLLVERGGSVFGVPLASIEEVLSVQETLSLAGRPLLAVRGRSVPLADLADLVDGPAPPLGGRAPALVLHSSGRRVAVVCDALIGEEEVVVKSLGPFLASLTRYLGAAILGDGRIALLLDPSGLVRGVSQRAASPSDLLAPAPTSADAAPAVLVVEDSVVVRELQRSILEAAGYTVVTARDGRDAMERLGRGLAVQLVVTDVDMPEMNGFELTEAIRADPMLSTLPVIVVTSRGDDDDRARGITAGADAYVVKGGFNQQEMLATVERLIGR